VIAVLGRTDYREEIAMNVDVIVRGSRRLARLGAVISLGLIALSAVPANATMYQKVQSYSGTDPAQDFTFCGLDIHEVFTFSGKMLIRAGTGDLAGAFFGHDNYQYLDTWTNVANGKFFTISGNALNQDVQATHVEGSIFEFVTHQVGQPYTVRDMTGAVVLRDRGSLSFTYLFDTGGDNVPGGTNLEDISLRVSGPHPGFFLDEAAQCAGVIAMIG
jgi:hypothetical protein